MIFFYIDNKEKKVIQGIIRILEKFIKTQWGIHTAFDFSFKIYLKTTYYCVS